MSEESGVERRRQFCARCGQLMFEYFRSPDGHFGLVDSTREAARKDQPGGGEYICPTCGARYRWLGRLNAMGQPIERQ